MGKNFRYILGSTQVKDGTLVTEEKIRLAEACSSMTSLAMLPKNKTISFPRDWTLRTNHFIPSILLYGCESWTQTADLERQIQAFENKCYMRMLGISQNERVRMATGHCPRQTSGDLIVARQVSRVIMVRPRLRT